MLLDMIANINVSYLNFLIMDRLLIIKIKTIELAEELSQCASYTHTFIIWNSRSDLHLYMESSRIKKKNNYSGTVHIQKIMN